MTTNIHQKSWNWHFSKHFTVTTSTIHQTFDKIQNDSESIVAVFISVNPQSFLHFQNSLWIDAPNFCYLYIIILFCWLTPIIIQWFKIAWNIWMICNVETWTSKLNLQTIPKCSSKCSSWVKMITWINYIPKHQIIFCFQKIRKKYNVGMWYNISMTSCYNIPIITLINHQ